MNETIIMIAASAALLAITIGCSALVWRFARRGSVGVLAGGLIVPVSFVLGLLYWLLTMEVDDAPPGMVILGTLAVVAVAAPITFFVSSVTVWLLRRHSKRNGS